MSETIFTAKENSFCVYNSSFIEKIKEDFGEYVRLYLRKNREEYLSLTDSETVSIIARLTRHIFGK